MSADALLGAKLALRREAGSVAHGASEPRTVASSLWVDGSRAGRGLCPTQQQPKFKRQRIIFLSVASKVRWKIKLLKKKAASAARAGERGSSLLLCRSHGKAKETDPSRGGGDERHGDSQVHGVDLRGGERPRGTLKQQRGAEEREGERRPGRRPSLPPACTSQCEDSQK